METQIELYRSLSYLLSHKRSTWTLSESFILSELLDKDQDDISVINNLLQAVNLWMEHKFLRLVHDDLENTLRFDLTKLFKKALETESNTISLIEIIPELHLLHNYIAADELILLAQRLDDFVIKTKSLNSQEKAVCYKAITCLLNSADPKTTTIIVYNNCTQYSVNMDELQKKYPRYFLGARVLHLKHQIPELTQAKDHFIVIDDSTIEAYIKPLKIQLKEQLVSENNKVFVYNCVNGKLQEVVL